MRPILRNVVDANGTFTTKTFTPQKDVTIVIPSAYDGDSLTIDDAVGYVQIRLPDGTWVDYADGLSGEQLTAAGAKRVEAPGADLRIEFRGADGATDIPLVAVIGNAAVSGSPSAGDDLARD